MKVGMKDRISFGLFKKIQPAGGDLRGVKKDLVSKTPPYFSKDLAYLTLKYKG